MPPDLPPPGTASKAGGTGPHRRAPATFHADRRPGRPGGHGGSGPPQPSPPRASAARLCCGQADQALRRRRDRHTERRRGSWAATVKPAPANKPQTGVSTAPRSRSSTASSSCRGSATPPPACGPNSTGPSPRVPPFRTDRHVRVGRPKLGAGGSGQQPGPTRPRSRLRRRDPGTRSCASPRPQALYLAADRRPESSRACDAAAPPSERDPLGGGGQP